MADLSKTPEPGTPVVFFDTYGKRHHALVTRGWTPTGVNVVYVTDASDKQDSYGSQIERASSVTHKSISQMPGYFWQYPDEQ